jgi:hypothetical protein
MTLFIIYKRNMFCILRHIYGVAVLSIFKGYFGVLRILRSKDFNNEANLISKQQTGLLREVAAVAKSRTLLFLL